MERFKMKWWQHLLLFGTLAYMAWRISGETEAKEIIYRIETLTLCVVVFVGRWLNFIVVRLNGDRMPVFFFWFRVAKLEVKITAIEDDGVHSTLGKNTKAKFLCDIFPIVWIGLNGKPKFSMASVGDLFQLFAIFYAIIISIRHDFF